MDSYRCVIQLQKLYRIHRKLLSVMLRKEGITSGQPPLLEVLYHNEGLTQCELSRRCHLEPATVTSTLTLMERNGLIERRPDMEDRRIRRIYLTNKGFEKCLRLIEVTKTNASVCFDNLTEEEQTSFLNISRKIIGNIGESLEIPGEDESEDSAVLVE